MRAGGRDLARLEHHGAARGERGDDLAEELIHRPVPRRDHPDHPDGLLQHARLAEVFLELERLQDLQHRHRVREPHGRLRVPTELHGRAHLVRDRGTDVGEARLVGGEERAEERDPLLARRLRERLERAPRRRDRGVHVLGPAERQLADHLLGGRVDHVELALRSRHDPRAVDVDLRQVVHGFLPLANAYCDWTPPSRRPGHAAPRLVCSRTVTAQGTRASP